MFCKEFVDVVNVCGFVFNEIKVYEYVLVVVKVIGENYLSMY